MRYLDEVKLLPALFALLVLALGAAPLRADELPLTRVVLSTAGLAQFTRSGPVTESAVVDLTVRLDQVDDILKSLSVFDRIGSLGAVSLPGRERSHAAYSSRSPSNGSTLPAATRQ